MHQNGISNKKNLSRNNTKSLVKNTHPRAETQLCGKFANIRKIAIEKQNKETKQKEI